MAGQNSFYIHLPSNNLSDVSRNRLNRYWTHLRHPIRLDGSWEVALTDISYTLSWFNVQDTEVSVCTFGSLGDKSLPSLDSGEMSADRTSVTKTVTCQGSCDHDSSRIESVDSSSLVLYSFKVPAGFYTLDEMVNTVNEYILINNSNNGDASKAPHLVLASNRRIYSITGKRSVGDINADTFIQMHEPLASLMGFDWVENNVFTAFDTKHGRRYKHMFPNFPDARGARYALFVYSDIIKTVNVGDHQANLLRIVHIPDKGSFGQQVDVSFSKPEYKPLATSEISTIEMYIKDESGEDVAFEFGRTIATLHFRRAKTHYD